MQIIKLEFEGIGPFTARHSIDVAAVGAGGLFLLEGPTGSGKTTILDALVFALYGDVAGADSSKARVVSTRLPPGVEPFVEATIETGRGLLRVRRVPQHERRKTRGTGTTVGKAAIQLWRLASVDDPGTLLSTSLQDATEELQRAIGLTKVQFTQTVVLPQGDFATFLRAKPEDRRGVLQDIFGTEFYERCARRLQELAAGYRAKDADARGGLDQAAATFATVAWDADARGPFEAAALAGDPMRAFALAGDRVGELAAEESGAGERAASASALHEAAQRALREARERNEAMAERAKLSGRLQQLELAGPAIEAHAVRLGAAEGAEHARRPMDALAGAKAVAESANAEARRGLATIADSADGDLVELGPGELEASALAAHEIRSALEESARLEGGLGERAETLRLGEENLARRRADAEHERALIEADRDAARGLEAQAAEATTLAATVGDRVADEGAARACREACVRREALVERLSLAGLHEARLVEQAVTASRRLAAARASWLEGLAGTLASELGDEDPCPVCGSTEHPAPAVRPVGAPERAEVEGFELAVREADRALAEERSQNNLLAEALGGEREAAGDTTLPDAESEFSAAVQRREVAERSGVVAVELRSRREALLTGASDRERELHAAEQGFASEQGVLKARAERLGADRVRVAEHVATYGSVAERVAALRRRADRASSLSGLRRAVTAAAEERQKREAELAVILAEKGIVDAADARAALLPEAERARLHHALDDHRAALATVTERLGDARLAGLEDAAAIDLAELLGHESAAKSAAAEAERVRGGLTARLRAASEASGRLQGRITALDAIRAKAEPYLAMADLANAGPGNQAAVTLPTFVLLRRFEEVVDFANARLDAMTGGRYSLRRTDAREGRSHKLGLGLEVVDHASCDAARDPKTLSGGETFQASLAMALGLADAVTAEAGGIELNTLFVDEGFGSLDSEALDMVMDQLTELRDTGRCIGVISHVADMKQRIAERITVIPRRDGTSTLRCSTDGPAAWAG